MDSHSQVFLLKTPTFEIKTILKYSSKTLSIGNQVKTKPKWQRAEPHSYVVACSLFTRRPSPAVGQGFELPWLPRALSPPLHGPPPPEVMLPVIFLL